MASRTRPEASADSLKKTDKYARLRTVSRSFGNNLF